MNNKKENFCKTYLEYKNKSGQLSKLPVPEELEDLNSNIHTMTKQEELNNEIMNKESMTNYYSNTIVTTDLCSWVLLILLLGFVSYKSLFQTHYKYIIKMIAKIK
jgi:hypothetical protein